MNTPVWEGPQAFCYRLHALFGCRRGALFAALAATWSAPILETPAHLSERASSQWQPGRQCVHVGGAAGVTTPDQASSAIGDRKPDLIFPDLPALLAARRPSPR